MPDEEVKLPRWFRIMKKMATELAIGFIGAFILLLMARHSIQKDAYQILNLIIITLGLPCVVLSCSNVIEIIKNIRSNGNN